MSDVSFMIVNERDAHSRAMYWELKRRAPPGIPVYQQSPFQDDVWEALDGDKDDFLVYDRCGLLTFHIVLPYSFLHSPYIEAAIRATYHKNICNCSASTLSSSKITTSTNETTQFNVSQTAAIPDLDTDVPDRPHSHHHHNHHNHHNPHHTSHNNSFSFQSSSPPPTATPIPTTDSNSDDTNSPHSHHNHHHNHNHHNHHHYNHTSQ
ncbi:Selenoprotein Pb [Larimichthys crocea]|uniref:Uncharacterized protein n=2 Tax=Larimichthys crocea TaxID=215358 RepID=A0ACD3QSP9_LARCR|nr:Selenoprotein Pb [Larimichthys crocea]